jgi:HK97 family phage major capsid protein
MEQTELDLIAKEAEKVEAKMVKLVENRIDPIIEKLAKLGEITPAEAEEIKKYGLKFEAFQKQLDALDIKIQKSNVPDEYAPLEQQINNVISKATWVANFKETKKGGGTFDLKGIDLHRKADVTRVADTIAPQFTGFQYVPGRRFHVRDILPVGTTTAPYVWMPYESATTNGIARVAEAGQKPVSDFTPAVVKWAIEKIATRIKFSEEILEDMPMFTSYLTTRWLELLKQAEDVKLLYGTGSSDIKGLTVSGTAWTDNLADSSVDLYMVLDSATTQVQTANFTPNYILLHPTDAMKLRQLRDTTKAPYFLYSLGQNQPISINGATIIATPAMTVGDFLVGDFAMGAQIWDRKAANISFYDQNQDDAIYNLILAIIEERLALVTYQSTAFVFGVIASALARGSA